MARLAVVGAGISGVACAQVLLAAGHDLTVLDRGFVPGGRMASSTWGGRRVDLGASYLTATDPAFRAVVGSWVERGLAHPWSDRFAGQRGAGPVRYGAAAGLRSLVEDLATGLTTTQSTHVRSVGPGPTVDGARYDAVVLAVPDPQALAVLDPSLADVRALLADRPWEPALALVAAFAQRIWDEPGWFVHDDPVLSWVADDGSRRGDGAPVLVAHSTPGFAAGHLVDPDAAGPALVAALREALDLPEPTWSRVRRWTFAKPVGSREEPYGLVGRIGLCGDGWGRSKVEGAWLSGRRLGAALVAELG